MLKIIRAKLHGITVTDADLEYHGSITLDPIHCKRAGIYPMEFVDIWNKNSGSRISTYVIFGEPGSNVCILNGSAARSCQKGDELIIAASTYAKPEELYDINPTVLTFTPENEIDDVFTYDVYQTNENDYNFQVLSERDGACLKLKTSS